jgi:SAM-dependent methyltransferase
MYSLLRPFDHPLVQHVHGVLKAINAGRLLDVGGRRSNYTVGLSSEIWISDLPREHEFQRQLDLGATDELRTDVLRRRSNIHAYFYDDMTRTQLPAHHFSAVSAVEVLEHVADDEAFVANVSRVLMPSGFFVMTTPNGDWKPIPYADHKRHYQASALEALLRRHFPRVTIGYRVNAGRAFDFGYRFGRSPLGMLGYGLSGAFEKLGVGGNGPLR